MERSTRCRILDYGLQSVGESCFLERLRSQRVHRPARFAQTFASEFAGATHMPDSMFRIFFHQSFLSSFHLNDNTGEPLGQVVVNVARHSRALFENSGL